MFYVFDFIGISNRKQLCKVLRKKMKRLNLFNFQNIGFDLMTTIYSGFGNSL